MIWILFANGLNPWPVFETWFTPMRLRLLMNNRLLSGGVMDKTVHGRRVTGLRKWRHFCCFMTLSNYQLNQAEEQQKNPLWKVQSLIDELNHHGRKYWIPGKWVAIDEQTIGFKGQSGMKLRISYK
jgi:hypothetical protein